MDFEDKGFQGVYVFIVKSKLSY